MSTERCYKCGVWGLSTKDCCGLNNPKILTVGELINRLSYLDRRLPIKCNKTAILDIVMKDSEVILKIDGSGL